MTIVFKKNQGELVYVTEKETLKPNDFAYCTETAEVIQISEVLCVDHLYRDTNGGIHYDNFDPWNWRRITVTNDHRVYKFSDDVRRMTEDEYKKYTREKVILDNFN